jgi:hypothetical protein
MWTMVHFSSNESESEFEGSLPIYTDDDEDVDNDYVGKCIFAIFFSQYKSGKHGVNEHSSKYGATLITLGIQ